MKGSSLGSSRLRFVVATSVAFLAAIRRLLQVSNLTEQSKITGDPEGGALSLSKRVK
ncbi:MAG: hypothetical protein CNIPEHKO_01024 [Anaerolineales bacterium]|nr:hypothetical protein [Anaerolineales bacterium]